MKKYMKKYRHKKSFGAKKNKFFWLGSLILIIFGGGIYLFIFSSVFQIKEIQVFGTEKTSPEEIKNVISENTDNIFLADFENLNMIILERYPKIANTNFKRKLPGNLIVQIEERKPVIALFRDENYFFVDKEGVVFEKVLEMPPAMLIVRADSIDKEKVEQVLKIRSNQTVSIEEISIVSKARLDAKTTEGWEIYFNPEENLDWQIRELDLILKEKIPSEERRKIEYIDLRFNKVYIKKPN